MEFSQDVLGYGERAIMCLRTLYRQYGYTQYRMSRFEEYGLYAENRAFLSSADVITFTGAGGKLMALRPDVTLSIVKNARDDGTLKKLYYNENIYRPDGFEFKEQMQIGLECIGDISVDLLGEVLMLAKRSLGALGGNIRLDVSHMGFLNGLLQSAEIAPALKTELLQCFSAKNLAAVEGLCAGARLDDGFRNRLAALIRLYCPIGEGIGALREISVNAETGAALRELEDVHSVLRQLGAEDCINLDFSIVNDMNYYNGVIFQGYIDGIPNKVLSGGRYDELLRKFGKKSGAVGFAVYLDKLDGVANTTLPDTAPTGLDGVAHTALPDAAPTGPDGVANTALPDTAPTGLDGVAHTTLPDAARQVINIALPKGRLGEKAYAIFEEAGYGCPSINEDSRKLVFESVENGVRYFWVKPSDVAIYVERGAADLGVAGKDIILEYSSDVYELLDLGIGKCRMCVAAGKGFADDPGRTLRVATKFSNIARDYYEKQGREIDIIRLNGSIELAPLLGLSDVIVDIVETGKTLEENNLETTDTIVGISARLISNKASYKFKHDAINKLCGKIS